MNFFTLFYSSLTHERHDYDSIESFRKTKKISGDGEETFAAYFRTEKLAEVTDINFPCRFITEMTFR